MAERPFPKPVADVVATLIEIFRHQNKLEMIGLIENAHVHFDEMDYDNWNDGTYRWALRLEVSVPTFVTIKPRLSDIEKEIETNLQPLTRLFSNDYVSEVTITPLTSQNGAIGQRMDSSNIDVRHLWTDGTLRLFLSHVSKYKVQVSELKNSLKDFGISAFIAHEDIMPSSEWQNEISLALQSMDALIALITPDFHSSLWTDQEIGWALGRNVPVLPVRLGTDPYGFAGKIQAIPKTLDNSFLLANEITQSLLRNSQTHGQMRSSLVSAFATSDCWTTARTLKDVIVKIEDITDEEKEALRKACVENNQVSGSWGVVDEIYRTFGRSQAVENSHGTDDVPF